MRAVKGNLGHSLQEKHEKSEDSRLARTSRIRFLTLSSEPFGYPGAIPKQRQIHVAESTGEAFSWVPPIGVSIRT